MPHKEELPSGESNISFSICLIPASILFYFDEDKIYIYIFQPDDYLFLLLRNIVNLSYQNFQTYAISYNKNHANCFSLFSMPPVLIEIIFLGLFFERKEKDAGTPGLRVTMSVNPQDMPILPSMIQAGVGIPVKYRMLIPVIRDRL